MSEVVNEALIIEKEREEADRVVAPYSTYNHRIEILSTEFVLDSADPAQLEDPEVTDSITYLGKNCGESDITTTKQVTRSVERNDSWKINSSFTFGAEIGVTVGGEATGGSASAKYSVSFTIGGEKSGSRTETVSFSEQITTTVKPKKEAYVKVFIAKTSITGKVRGKVRVVYWHQYTIDLPWYTGGDEESVRVRTFRDFPVEVEFETQRMTFRWTAHDRDADCNEGSDPFGFVEPGSPGNPLNWSEGETALAMLPPARQPVGFRPTELKGTPISADNKREAIAEIIARSRARAAKIKREVPVLAERSTLSKVAGTAFSTAAQGEALDAVLADALRAILIRGLSVAGSSPAPATDNIASASSEAPLGVAAQPDDTIDLG